jgi:hypothetical protein
MKRAQDGDNGGGAERKQLRASTIRLNVGGRYFETTEATLSHCSYFEPMLSGRFAHAVDPHGRLFIDRSPDLFAILLEFMRTLERPGEGLLRAHGEAIVKECLYYGLDTLPQIVRGTLAPDFYMRATDRAIKAEERAVLSDSQASNTVLDVYKADLKSRPREDLQQPLLLSEGLRPILRGGYPAFYERLNGISGGLMDDLRNIPRAVIAGGSVLAALTDVPHTDIDVFLVCPPDEAVACLRQIFEAVQRHHVRKGAKKRYLITRSQNAVTFYFSSVPGGAPPLQVILQTNPSVAHLLAGFDVDASCFCFFPSEGRVLCSKRGERALQYSANLMDSAHAGPSYCRRLETVAAHKRRYSLY